MQDFCQTLPPPPPPPKKEDQYGEGELGDRQSRVSFFEIMEKGKTVIHFPTHDHQNRFRNISPAF